ncbi:hypothetical protein EYD10_08891 [Varanus komodoensis]|nr:hypothetical protein EYD10_08891 [Varanus komodoensis]
MEHPGASGGEEVPGKMNSRRGGGGGVGGGGRVPEDESKNKPKLNLQIKTLADDVRDRLTSFRKSGVKKEKLLIQHPIDSQASINELPVAQPLFDERSMNLSEKEVMDLFEKMMEDMNLNEERKAPLRNKDLTTKREMVVQYISATAKSCCPAELIWVVWGRLQAGSSDETPEPLNAHCDEFVQHFAGKIAQVRKELNSAFSIHHSLEVSSALPCVSSLDDFQLL